MTNKRLANQRFIRSYIALAGCLLRGGWPLFLKSQFRSNNQQLRLGKQLDTAPSRAAAFSAPKGVLSDAGHWGVTPLKSWAGLACGPSCQSPSSENSSDSPSILKFTTFWASMD